jgi:predicted ArsR family transcriptional regulator
MTVQDFAGQIGISTVAVRKHLDGLAAEGLVEGRNRAGARGRPAAEYHLTEAGENLFPRGYNHLLVDFLQDLADLEGEQKLERLFHQRNERLAHAYQMRLVGKPLREAVRELAQAREDEGYMAHVEESAEGLVLTEHNCPIIEVAQRFPQACRCEQQLFEQLLGAPVRRETTLAHGDVACRYHIREK